MKKITPGESWNARIEGKVAEAMALTGKKKAELSSEICGSDQKLTRLSGRHELWNLPFRDVALIAEAAGCEIAFIRRTR